MYPNVAKRLATTQDVGVKQPDLFTRPGGSGELQQRSYRSSVTVTLVNDGDNRLTQPGEWGNVPRMNRTQNARELVPALAQQVERRMNELEIDGISALAKVTGVTVQGLQPLLRGERRDYRKNLTGPVCRAFGWSPDSIKRILAGGEPVMEVGAEVVPLRNGTNRSGVPTADDVDRLALAVDSLAQRVGWLERRLGRSDPQPGE
jgi:hypothetical protein